MDVKIREIKVKVADVTFNQDEIQAQREIMQFFVDNAPSITHEQQKLLDAFEIEPTDAEEEDDEFVPEHQPREDESLAQKALRQSNDRKLPRGIEGPKGRVRGRVDESYQTRIEETDEATESL